jgi:SAM-dependent methyltransferase
MTFTKLDHQLIDKKNKITYKKKILLKIIYKDYYKLIKKNLLQNKKFKILELGSGGGNIKKIIPECITSDQFKSDEIDKKINIYNIDLRKNSTKNVIMIDVFHHLEFPSLALQEIKKILIRNGRLIMIEPAMGLIPRVIYKLFHYEPNGSNYKINWKRTSKKSLNKNKYFAAQSLPWRAFVLNELNLKNNFKVNRIEIFSDFSFLFSGGYSYPSFYPLTFYPIIKYIDLLLTFLSKRLFGARMLIVLEKI